MNNKAVKFLVIGLIVVLGSMSINAQENDILVVVHKDNPTTSMTRSQVIDLYMGKYVAFPGGKKAIPVDISKPESIKKDFYQLLVGLSPARVNSYWSRIKFSGRARPPVEIDDAVEVVNFIRESPSAIAYIPRNHLTNEMKIVFSFDE